MREKVKDTSKRKTKINKNTKNDVKAKTKSKNKTTEKKQNKTSKQVAHNYSYPSISEAGNRCNNPVYSSIYAERIKELIKHNYWNVNQLSAMSGVKQTTIDNIIHGVSKNPTTKTIHMIANAFGMTFSEFVNCNHVNEYPLDIEKYAKRKKRKTTRTTDKNKKKEKTRTTDKNK